MRLEVFPAQIVAPQGHPAFNDAGEREDDDTDIFVRKVFADRALKDFDVFFGVCRGRKLNRFTHFTARVKRGNKRFCPTGIDCYYHISSVA